MNERWIIEFVAVLAQHEQILEHVQSGDEISDDDGLSVLALNGKVYTIRVVWCTLLAK